jgi:ABC-2 type transport system ATP-binding protein
MAAVEIEHVTKTFGSFTAVDNLSLRVPAGTIYGFIGPNGSGKTTTLRMIMRILHPDRGTIRVLGETTLGAANDRVGYLPEERGLYKQMKVRDVLRFYAELKGCHHNGPLIDDWLERMGLTAWAGKRVQALSKGMSQKVQFIATVVSQPELVLLDEPFSGLDPVNAEVLRDAILGLRRDGATVIFSTHDMAVAEKMCDFIFMIYQGRKVLDGTLNTIQDTYGSDTIRVHLEGPSDFLAHLAGVVKVTDFGRYQELRLDKGADPQQILARIMEHGRVRHFELTRPTLHDIFVRIAQPHGNGVPTVQPAAPPEPAIRQGEYFRA